ncbi:LamB/YcsF family protein [Anaeromicrobium sediminis]|uniref:5-oxoprolinase subunit A n=1 Tax=Anaeromicrobium sediminis TaxID=1478221 RepID=A0A267MIV2_9FIRM|nr:5-oxoprolinase subunit PxpA [Anaeromicrobium sediminis]PAB58795.1 lactam utilization protein LamB [Anaeromicrobium sediminis]
MYEVDLNSDIGESFGNYKVGLDEEVIKYVTSANIACGWHAGDPLVMEKTVQMASEKGVGIGAHPGYLDLMGFGRRNIVVTPEEVKAYIKYQLGALMAFAISKGEKIQHVKPHGAMYNMAAKDKKLSMAIAEAIYEVDEEIILMGLANSEIIKAGKTIGLKVCNEVFADRAYNPDGTLVSRKLKGAVIHDADLAISRVIRMVKEGKVTAINGEDIEIEAQSICVHGDNPEAVEFVKKIRLKLEEEGVKVTAISNFIK